MSEPIEGTISWEDFRRVDIRVGTVVEAEPLPGTRKPFIRLRVDFGGDIGERGSAAQLTRNYEPSALVGRQVAAACNLAPRSVAGFRSEVLVLGFPDGEGEPVLLAPDSRVADGGRLF